MLALSSTNLLQTTLQEMCELQMVQRPTWRRRAAESGVLLPLVNLVHPSIMSIDLQPEVSQSNKEAVANNMLMQVLLAINWYALEPSPPVKLPKTRIDLWSYAASTTPQHRARLAMSCHITWVCVFL
jgi:hypothetical protein